MEHEAEQSRLSRVLQLTAAELKTKFEKLRDAVEHNGVVGEEGEKIVAAFLRERLPASIGVTTGEVLDVEGGRSRQADVILYDAMRTPMIFTGEEKDTHVVPAEGVLAVIEVKTRLRAGDLEGCLKNCRSIKQLVRTAYFPQNIQVRHIAYGREWDDLPIFYSVFAAGSDNLYAGPLNQLQADVPIHERIDMLCCLDRGVTVNAGIDLSGGIEALEPVISPRSLPRGGLADVDKSKPLLVWYAMLASIVMQAGTRPIDITRYVAKDLRVQAQMPSGAIGKAMADEALVAMAQHQGVNPDILRRMQARKPLTSHDRYQLMRAPGYSPGPDLPEVLRPVIDDIVQAARTMPYEEWKTFTVPLPGNGPGVEVTDTP